MNPLMRSQGHASVHPEFPGLPVSTRILFPMNHLWNSWIDLNCGFLRMFLLLVAGLGCFRGQPGVVVAGWWVGWFVGVSAAHKTKWKLLLIFRRMMIPHSNKNALQFRN